VQQIFSGFPTYQINIRLKNIIKIKKLMTVEFCFRTLISPF
jgi:hypothetical protein